MRADTLALEDCAQAIELNPKEYSAYWERAEIHSILGFRKGPKQEEYLEAAIRDFEKALALAPADWVRRETVKESLEKDREKLKRVKVQ